MNSFSQLSTEGRRLQPAPAYRLQTLIHQPHPGKARTAGKKGKAIRLNTYRRQMAGYDPPPLPEDLCGPDLLADLMIHAREFSIRMNGGDRSWLAPLSHDGVKRLLGLVYYASSMPEEGRFPQFKLVAQAEGTVFLVSHFEPVHLYNPDQLRRLAPACTRPDCALLVMEHREQLWCEGVVNVGGLGYGTILGTPGIASVGSGPMFRIEVFGPGHIRAWEGPLASYEIRAGKVRPLATYDVRNATDRLREAVQARIAREVVPVLGDKSSLTVKDSRPFLLVLSKMLRTAADARHGGAFIFLPTPPSEANDFGVRLLYRTDHIDLGDDIAKQWLAFDAVSKSKGKMEYARAVRWAESNRVKTLTDAEAVGNFSCVDGCVVLTYDLRVLGFGAKIDVSSTESKRSPRRFKHVASGTIYEDDIVMRSIGGTRHQSVARLCQTHEGVVVYTLSQDGELKLFYSDVDCAYVFGPLDLPTIDHELHIM